MQRKKAQLYVKKRTVLDRDMSNSPDRSVKRGASGPMKQQQRLARDSTLVKNGNNSFKRL